MSVTAYRKAVDTNHSHLTSKAKREVSIAHCSLDSESAHLWVWNEEAKRMSPLDRKLWWRWFPTRNNINTHKRENIKSRGLSVQLSPNAECWVAKIEKRHWNLFRNEAFTVLVSSSNSSLSQHRLTDHTIFLILTHPQLQTQVLQRVQSPWAL